MVLYIENPKNSTRNIEPTKNLVNLWSTKSINRNLWCFYELIMNYQKEKLEKQAHLCMIVPKRIKNLVINLTKGIKDLYSENYKALKKNIKEYTNKWKLILCPQIEIITS